MRLGVSLAISAYRRARTLVVIIGSRLLSSSGDLLVDSSGNHITGV